MTESNSATPQLRGKNQYRNEARSWLSGAAIQRIRNPRTPNSELVITPRPNGGVTITQGPAHILVARDEVPLMIEALHAVSQTGDP